MTIEVETSFNENIVLQRIFLQDETTKQRNMLSSKMIDLSENGVKEVLIKIGWTPPKEKKDESNI